MLCKLVASLVVLGLTVAAPPTSTRGEVCSSHEGRLENCPAFEEMETKSNKHGDPSGDNSSNDDDDDDDEDDGDHLDDEDDDDDDNLDSLSIGWTHSVGSLEAAKMLGLLGVTGLAAFLCYFIKNSLVSYYKRVRHQQYQQLT